MSNPDLPFEPAEPAHERYKTPSPLISQKVAMLVGRNKRVHDIGCATGALGMMLKENGCYIAGVEINEESAKLAKKRLDSVHMGDIEEIADKLPWPREFFDIILCIDILEHLKRPDLVLLKIKKYLKRDGTLMASIPNVAHWSVRIGILLGRFNYGEYGICDKTHIRFFTLKSIKQLFEKTGYVIVKTDYTEFPPARKWLPAWIAYKTLLKLSRTWAAFQFVICAKPRPL